MKIQMLLALSVIMSMLISCMTRTELAGDFNLLPQPQHAEFTGTSALSVDDILYYYIADGSELPALGSYLQDIKSTEKEGQAQVIFSIDGSLDLKKEGYTLEISRKQISIVGKDEAGLLYGFITLDQLLEDATEQGVPLPLCSIKDFPLLSYRAIHLDVKHHLEKTEYYYRLLDQLSRYKVNAIIAEMEDKLAYERQPVVGSEDALSIEDWKKLSDYAIKRNIEISPLIQGLGHASFVLKHDQYKELRDDPKSDWAFNPLDPETYKVQFDLYRDAMDATPYGRYLHVGGDEVHTTGRGSGKSQLELQMTWLNKVCKFADENGRIPIFWDDMPIKHAGLYRPMFSTEHSREDIDKLWEDNEHKLLEFLDLFPKNCIYMRWNYSSPQAEGNIKAMEWFSENGFQVMGATAGQTRWALMPQNEGNMENIKSFALTSIEKGLEGLLLTLWDDDSPHFELYMRGILAFAEYSWTGDKRSREEIKAAYRHREFSNAVAGDEFAFIDRLEKPVAFWDYALLDIRRHVFLKTHNNPLEEAIIDLPDEESRGQWSVQYADRLVQAAEALEACDSIAARIKVMKSLATRNTYRLEVYEQVNQLVRFSAQALLTLQAYDQAQTERETAEVLGDIKDLSKEFEVLRDQLEKVYSEIRILSKPEGYFLDQDHHSHLANQSISFDWLFIGEMLFLEKVEKTL